VPPSNQADVIQLATWRAVKPGRKAGEVADAEEEMHFNQGKKFNQGK